MQKISRSMMGWVLVLAILLGLGMPPMTAQAAGGAAPENVTVPPASTSDTQIVLIWDKPEDYESQNIVDYEIAYTDGVTTVTGSARDSFADNYKYLNAWVDAFYTTANAAATAGSHYEIDIHSFTATGLDPETEYIFQVRAVYADSTCSEWSDAITETTAATPEIIDVVADYGVTTVSDKYTEYSGSLVVAGANNNSTAIQYIEDTTAAIQAAIDNCPPGGKVVLPGSGDNANPVYYVSGSLFLHSNMTFEIEEGAVLLGSPVFDHYPRNLLVYDYSQDIRTYGLINAVTWDTGSPLENIRIVGGGAVDGNGWQYNGGGTTPIYQSNSDVNLSSSSDTDPTGNNWRLPYYWGGSRSNVTTRGILAKDAYDKTAGDGINYPDSDPTPKYYNTRPNLTVARGVDGIYYEGLTFYNPAFHGVVNYHCEGVVANGTIHMTFDTNNGDGIEFGDCHDLYVFNNFFDTGDDAINFASGQGSTVRNTSDKVACGEGVVFNNYVRNGHGGLLAIGSHVGGIIGDLLAEDNIYNPCESGSNGALRMKASPNGGGGIRNIVFRDTAMHYSVASGNNSTIIVDTNYSDSNASTAYGPESETALTYENIYVSNLTITDNASTSITKPALMSYSSTNVSDSLLSMTSAYRNFTLEDITILDGTGGAVSFINLDGGTFRNINTSINVGTGNKNILIENCGTGGTQNMASDEVTWSAGSFDATVLGNQVTLVWPAAVSAEGYPVTYEVYVDDLDDDYQLPDGYASAGYKEKESGIAATTTSFALAPDKTYKVAVRAVTSSGTVDYYGDLIETTFTTGSVGSLTAPTPGTSLSSYGSSGISWQALQWNLATDATYDIHYYEITATPTDPAYDTLTFRAYMDRAGRNGYALWGLEDGVEYTISLSAVNWVGEKAAYSNTITTITVPGTLTNIPEWDANSQVQVDAVVADTGLVDMITLADGIIVVGVDSGATGAKLEIEWDENDVTDYSVNENHYPDTADFAGYRVTLDGIAQQPDEGGLDQVNAIPTTTGKSWSIDLDELTLGRTYTVAVEAGNEIYKIALGSGGLSGSDAFTGIDKTLARNQVTFGKWTNHGPSIQVMVTDEVHTVTFDANGGSPASTEVLAIAPDYTVADLPVVTRSGYTFAGWNTDPDGQGTAFDETTVVTNNLRVYAQWTLNPTDPGNGGRDTYQITYDANGGSGGYTGPVVAAGGTDTVLGDEETGIRYFGYELDSWNTRADGSGTDYLPGDTVTMNADLTLYAQWLRNLDVPVLSADDGFAYIVGHADGTFGPDNPITRAEAATLFFRLVEDEEKDEYVPQSPFSDVDEDQWYGQAICYLAEKGVLKGYDDGTFKPDAPIGRAEFVTLISRFSDLVEGEVDFTDVDSGHWAYAEIVNAVAREWVTGYDDGTFKPENPISRAEVVTLVNRVIGRELSLDDVDPADLPSYSDLDESHWAYWAIMAASMDL